MIDIIGGMPFCGNLLSVLDSHYHFSAAIDFDFGKITKHTGRKSIERIRIFEEYQSALAGSLVESFGGVSCRNGREIVECFLNRFFDGQ